MSKAVEYSEKDRQLGMRCLALAGGSPTRAQRQMEAAGRPVPRETLRDWKETADYQLVLSDMRKEIGEQTANEASEIAGLATQVERSLIENLQGSLHDLEAREMANAALKVAQVKEINVRTSRLLRDQPDSITEIRDPADILAELKHLGLVKDSVPGTAEEL